MSEIVTTRDELLTKIAHARNSSRTFYSAIVLLATVVETLVREVYPRHDLVSESLVEVPVEPSGGFVEPGIIYDGREKTVPMVEPMCICGACPRHKNDPVNITLKLDPNTWTDADIELLTKAIGRQLVREFPSLSAGMKPR